MRLNIEEVIERYYNGRRLHSVLGYVPPEGFGQKSSGESYLSHIGNSHRCPNPKSAFLQCWLVLHFEAKANRGAP